MIVSCKIYSRNRDSSAVQKPAIDKAYTFRKLQIKDFKNCRLASEKNRYNFFKERIKDGHEAFGWIYKEEVVGYLWLSGQKNTLMCPFEAGTKLSLNKNQIYIWDCRTQEQHRRKKLFKAALINIAENKMSNCDVLIATRGENEYSKRAILGAGFEKILEVKLYAIFKLTTLVIISRRWIFLFGKKILELNP